MATAVLLGASYVASRVLWWAYKIRLQAIEEYGPVIHEFDPYFNYRATEVGRQSAMTEVCFLRGHWLLITVTDLSHCCHV